ncbi:hypothetical protein ALC56_14185 [Trachymyrmex septentrionalis]|uniref:Uncharacterized protein n=1 Tax=Trachymyrmex septentrionalis TaxID=34720 RepID=A0A195ETU8_9HYME|nr:hypothetical protein ALC56_14185 [Trachymyrmex septentrionalis]
MQYDKILLRNFVNEIYRQDDVDGFDFRYFPLSSMRVSSLVNGNLSLTPHGRSEAGVNGEVQNRRNSPMRCLSAGNFQAAHVLEPVRSHGEDLDVASFRLLLHLKYASPLSSMLQFNFGRPAIGGGPFRFFPRLFPVSKRGLVEPESPRLWLMAQVLKLRQLGSGLKTEARAYVGNNLRHAEVLSRVFGSPVVISFIKFLSTRVGKFLSRRKSPSNQQSHANSQIAGGREVIRGTRGMVPRAALHSGPIKFQQLPVQAGLPPRGENRLVLQSNGAHGFAPLGDTRCNVLTPRRFSFCMKLYRGVIQCRPAIFLPDGASTNGTIARQARSGKEQGAVKGAVGRGWEARERSLGCRGAGGNRRRETEHVYNVSIKCHVHKLCSTRHRMLFRIFLNNQYSDTIFRRGDSSLLVHINAEALVVDSLERIQTIIFGVDFGCPNASKHFDGSSMKWYKELAIVEVDRSRRSTIRDRWRTVPKISKFVMGQLPTGILCRQKVSQERNRLSKQEVDLPAIVALPLMPA